MRYNYGEIEALFEEIKNLLNYVNEERLTTKNYFLFLANLPQGEKIEYELTKESIPHLLGINTTYLVSTGLYSSKNSYYAVLEMLDDPYRIYNLAKEGKIDLNRLFSKHIDKKLKCFKNNININPHEIEAVSIYDKERTYTTSETSENFEYVIIKRYNDGTIGLLCLSKNNDNIYVPMSSQILETESEIDEGLKKILKNQEITILNGIHVAYFGSYKSYINLDEQITRIRQLQKYKTKYNVSIDINNNFLYYINKLKDNKEVFAQSEETSKYIEQSQELERIRKELNQLSNMKIELERQVLSLTLKNEELTEQVNKDSEFKTKLLKLTKELEN